MRNFRKYNAWKNALEVTYHVYELTDSFPDKEKYGLINQLRRASVSIASNIAEGASRQSETDFKRFLEMAMGSAFEVETQMLISLHLNYIKNENFEEILEKLNVVQKQINSLINKIKKNVTGY